MNYMAQFTPNGASFQYRDEEKQAFKDLAKLFEYRIKLERTSNSIFKTLVFKTLRRPSARILKAHAWAAAQR
jgi:hypothetical protein